MLKRNQVVRFKIGRESFGVDIGAIHEIVTVPDITRVPDTPDYHEGIINLRGKVLSVLDLRKRLGLDGSERGKKTFSRDGSKDRPKERAAHPKLEKKGAQPASHGRRSFPAGGKEAGAQVKPESSSQERVRPDRPRGERPKPGSRRPVERKREGAAQTAPAAITPQPAAKRSETVAKETKEKDGILKRFFKKILKKS